MYYAISLLNRSLDYYKDVLALFIGYNHLFILFLVRLTKGLFLCLACLMLYRTLVTSNVFTKVNLCSVLLRKALSKPFSCYFFCKVRLFLAPLVIYPYGIENTVNSFIWNFRLKVLLDLSIAYFRIFFVRTRSGYVWINRNTCLADRDVLLRHLCCVIG
jgi:hypothetical protein